MEGEEFEDGAVEQEEEVEEPDIYDCLTKDIPEATKFEKMQQFDGLRDGIDEIFEGGAIKDFYYDDFPDLAPNPKDAISDGEFAQCDLLKNENIQVVSYGKQVLRGVYSMQRDLEVADQSPAGIRNGDIIMQVEPLVAIVDKAMIK